MKKRHSEEQIIRILREAELHAVPIRDLCKQHNISEQTFYRWRDKYGGMEVADARRLQLPPLPTASTGPPKLVRNDYHRTETHCLSGYKKRSQVHVELAECLRQFPRGSAPVGRIMDIKQRGEKISSTIEQRS